jgi:hypothetical protein
MGSQAKERSAVRDCKLQARWRDRHAKGKFSTREEGIAYFRRFFAHVTTSRFLTGQTDGPRGPFRNLSLPWLMHPEHFLDVIEGKYHDA